MVWNAIHKLIGEASSSQLFKGRLKMLPGLSTISNLKKGLA